MAKNTHKKSYLHDYVPLIVIVATIIAATVLKCYWMHSWTLNALMLDFMGLTFLVFGSMKILNITKFVEAYATYDIPTQYFLPYGYLYPFLEAGLGLAFISRYVVYEALWFTIILMSISSIGVAREVLWNRRDIPCACLGMIFRLPMTYVTLGEDLLMVIMAAIMLYIR